MFTVVANVKNGTVTALMSLYVVFCSSQLVLPLSMKDLPSTITRFVTVLLAPNIV